MTNAKAQRLIGLALPAWGYPPPVPNNEDGTPGDPLHEMADYLVQTAQRGHRRALEEAGQGAINEAVDGVGL